MKKCKKSILRKLLLYKTGVEYGDYTVNHVLGCAHGCLYPCYAFMYGCEDICNISIYKTISLMVFSCSKTLIIV